MSDTRFHEERRTKNRRKAETPRLKNERRRIGEKAEVKEVLEE